MITPELLSTLFTAFLLILILTLIIKHAYQLVRQKKARKRAIIAAKQVAKQKHISKHEVHTDWDITYRM